MTFDVSAFSVSEGYVKRLAEPLRHRGPDGSGTWVADDGVVGLGFRRLAIIDLTPAANQPMTNGRRSIQLVFNGEIYNHAEIKKQLAHSGARRWLTDHSDTEVIIAAYERWGIDALQRLRGMFALALWDVHERELWLARDRIGVKPLYYSVHHGRIVFGSEVKALLTDPHQPRSVDERALYDYLSFLTTPAPQTLFSGIRKLPGGHVLRVRPDGSMEEQRYWDVWDHTRPLTDASEEDILDLVRNELRTSVRLRKISDVPVGVFLSGGVDSSTNAALFSEGESAPISTFSIGYEGEYDTYRNELEYARMMAEHVGATHHERILEQDDLIRLLPTMVTLQDEPIADPVCVPVYYVSELARQHGVVVCQVGEGADELFCGYPSWRRSMELQELADIPVPRWVLRGGLAALRASGRDRGWRFERLRRAAEGQPIFWGGAEAFTETQKRGLLNERVLRELGDVTSWDTLRPIRQRFEEAAWEPSHLHWMTYLDLRLRLPELLLMRVDKMSMGVSLEARVPFLDHEFVTLALSIPTSMKLGREKELKRVLKESVRGLVPDELIDRPKQGFGVPVYEWFHDRLGERMRDDIRQFARQADLLDPAGVEEVLAGGDGSIAWNLFNLALWWKAYIA